MSDGLVELPASGASRVHLVDRGPRDAEVLLFAHCWGLSSAAFDGFFDHMARHYRVVAPDLPGFGHTPAPDGPVSYEAYADVLARVLDDLHIERAHVAGLSMGGGTAFAFAARHPQRVRTLILMAPTGCPDVSLPRLACNRIWEFAEQAVTPGQGEGGVAIARSFLGNLLNHPATLLASLRMVASLSLLEHAGAVTAPTLLLWGARDRTVPPRLAARFAERLPNATLQVMPDSFHQLVAVRPENTARIIHVFISRASG